MKFRYFLVGDDSKTLFMEDKVSKIAIYYNAKDNKWYEGTYKLWQCRVGFDPSEPSDSIYRYGNLSYMEDIVEITESEAEQFLGRKITKEEIMEPYDKFNEEYQEHLRKYKK